MESPTGIIPESLMYPQKKAEVIAWLISQPAPSWTKRNLLAGWSITVGCRCKSSEYHLVEVSGTDNTVPAGA